jgi:hypothetical protein
LILDDLRDASKSSCSAMKFGPFTFQ